MNVVTFVTVFLGIVAGQQDVVLSVGDDVAKIELLLDHRNVALLTSRPWFARVDLGSTPLPHRLEAAAYDATGRLIGSATQMINFSSAPRDMRIVLAKHKARIVWSAVDVKKPDSVEARLDGRPVRIGRDDTIALPATNAGRIHLLEVTARIDNEAMTAQLIFGGAFQDTSLTALTAVPVALDDRRIRLDSIRCSAGDTPVRVVALDDLPAEVVIVRHSDAGEATVRLESGASQRRAGGFAAIDSTDPKFSLGSSDSVRFLWPDEQAGEGTTPSIMFASSHSYSTDIRTLLTTMSGPEESTSVRYCDAVAVAGLQAAQSQRPRAVVLILGEDYADKSRLRPREAHEYLSRLGVPLLVWSLADPVTLTPGAREWGDITDVSTVPRLISAVQSLRREIDRQRILWVEGDYLPSEVRVSGVDSLVH